MNEDIESNPQTIKCREMASDLADVVDELVYGNDMSTAQAVFLALLLVSENDGWENCRREFNRLLAITESYETVEADCE